jgi:hypothetical protein
VGPWLQEELVVGKEDLLQKRVGGVGKEESRQV